MKSDISARLPLSLPRPLLGGVLLAACLGLSGCELLDKFRSGSTPAAATPVSTTGGAADGKPAEGKPAETAAATPMLPSNDPATIPLAATSPSSTVPVPVPGNPPAVETTGPGQPTAPPAAQPEQLAAVGLSMEVGVYLCELNRRLSVKQIAPDGQAMVMTWAGRDYNLTAVRARSGALRYEDTTSGLTWITIVGKSLLLDLKAGQQLANECKHTPGATAEPTPPPVPVKTNARPAPARKKATP